MRTSQLAVMRDKIAEALSLANPQRRQRRQNLLYPSEKIAPCQFESGRLKDAIQLTPWAIPSP